MLALLLLASLLPQLTMLVRPVELPMPVTPLAQPMPVTILGPLLLVGVGVMRLQPTRLALTILAVSTQALLTTPPHIRCRHFLLYLPAVLRDFLKV